METICFQLSEEDARIVSREAEARGVTPAEYAKGLVLTEAHLAWQHRARRADAERFDAELELEVAHA